MFVYDKKLQYPVNIKNPNPAYASIIVSQLGGPDGELGASMRYLNQRFSMPDGQIIGMLTDVGTEELAHLEMVGAILYQLTKNMSEKQITEAGFDKYFVDHTAGVYTVAASGFPYNAASYAVKGDMLADLHEDLAAEQKARVTYDNLLRLIDDPDVRDPIKFLREREVVHYQRFAECLARAQEIAPKPNFYACNPSFDKGCADLDGRSMGNCGCGGLGIEADNGRGCGCGISSPERGMRQGSRPRCDKCGR